MVHFVGAGPGAPDLITLRGAELLRGADCVIYAGSLVNPALLGLCRDSARIYDSARMTLEQVLEGGGARRGGGAGDGTPPHRRPLSVRCGAGSRWTPWTGRASPGT